MKLVDLIAHKLGTELVPSLGAEYPRLAADADLFCLDEVSRRKLEQDVVLQNAAGQDLGILSSNKIKYLQETCTASLLSELLEKCPVGIIAIDATGRIFYCSQQYETILGIKRHRVMGRLLSDLEPEAQILQVLATGQPVWGKIVLIKTIQRLVKVDISPIYQQDRLMGAVSIFADVTEYHEMGQELTRVKGLVDLFQQELENTRELPRSFSEIEGQHPLFTKALRMAATVSPTDAPVLLLGEHGSGKEVVARAIHAASLRCDKPFIAVNCAAVPDSLLESELFGYEGGSFTGAKKEGRLGKFELAAGGTLFLDEIGDMPLSMQSKILRVLQEKEIEKIGRTQNIAIDVRIIAATNRNIAQWAEKGMFRADLYYRLNVVTIALPALKQRGDDIIILAKSLLKNCNLRYKKQLHLSVQVLQLLKQHDWPGNVRELANCLEYAVIMCETNSIEPCHLPASFGWKEQPVAVQEPDAEVVSWKQGLAEAEKKLLSQALLKSKGNKSVAIRSLGLSRRCFYKKITEYGLI